MEEKKTPQQKYYEANKEKIAAQRKAKYEANKDEIKFKYETNKETLKEKQLEYYHKNKEKLNENRKEYDKTYYEINKEFKKQKNKEYYEKTKLKRKLEYEKLKKDIEYQNKVKENRRINEKNRRKNDPLFKLTKNIRCLINYGIKRINHKKQSKTELILGCSFDEFKQHIENQFETWMTWDNYGLYNGELNYGWDIDHIIPQSKGLTYDEVIKLNHYTNLKPLCSKVNRDIKRNGE